MKQGPSGKRGCLLRVRQCPCLWQEVSNCPVISKGIDWHNAYSPIKFYIVLLTMGTQRSRTIMILNDLFMLGKVDEQAFLFFFF